MWSCNQQALQQQACNFAGASVGCKRAMVQRHRSGKRLQVVAVGWVRAKSCQFQHLQLLSSPTLLIADSQIDSEV